MASNTVKLVLSLKDSASKGLKGVASNASKANISVGGVTKAFGAVGLAAAAAGVAFVKMGQDVANQVNQINDLANVTGVSVNTLEDLKLMAGSTGLQFKDMERGVMKFTDSLGKARRDAEGTQAGVFAELGLDPSKMNDSDAALRQVVKQLGSLDDKSKQASIAMELFGGGGTKMLKSMQTSFEGAAYANNLMNLRMEDSTEEAGEMQRALALQQGVMDKLKLKAFNTFTGEGGFAHGIAVVTGIINGLMELLKRLGTLIVDLFKTVASVVEQLRAVGQGDWEAYWAAVNDGSGAIQGIKDGLVGIVTLDWVNEGVKAYVDFGEAMEALGKKTEDTNDDLEEQARIEAEKAAEDKKKREQDKKDAEAAKKKKLLNDQQRDSIERMIESLKDQRQALYKTAHGLKYFGQATTAATEEFYDSREAVVEYSTAIEDLAKRFEKHQGTWGYTQRQLMAIGEAAKGNVKDFKEAASAYSEWTTTGRKQEQHKAGDMPALIEEMSQHRRRGGYESDVRDDLDTLIDAAVLYSDAQAILDAPTSPLNIAKMDAAELGGALSDARSELEDTARHAQELALIWGDLATLEIGVGAEFDEVEEEIRKIYKGAPDEAVEPLIAELKSAFRSGGDLRTIMSEAIGEGFEEIEIKKAKIKEIEAQKAKIDKQEARLAKIESIQGAISQITGIASNALSGDVMGATSQALMSSGNPYAAGAGAVVGAFAELSELGQLAKDSSVQDVADNIVQSAEDSIEGIAAGIEVLEQILPDLMVMILADLPLAIIKAIPHLALALTQALVNGMMNSFGWMAKAWEQIKAWFGRTKEERRSDRAEAWDATKGWFEGFFGSAESAYKEGFESFSSGTGYVGKTGMALLHKGEAVIPVNGRGPQGVTAGGSPVNINISASVIDRDVIPRLVREIEKVTGRFGRMSASFA